MCGLSISKFLSSVFEIYFCIYIFFSVNLNESVWDLENCVDSEQVLIRHNGKLDLLLLDNHKTSR